MKTTQTNVYGMLPLKAYPNGTTKRHVREPMSIASYLRPETYPLRDTRKAALGPYLPSRGNPKSDSGEPDSFR